MNERRWIEEHKHLSEKEFVDKHNEIFNTGYSYNTIRRKRYDRKQKVEKVEGETEQSNKYDLTDKGYIVRYGNHSVEATHEEVRKALMMYCIGGMTLNQISLAMTWTRAEFYAIKTAFGITKDSPPFTPYDLDSMDAEQLAEKIRIEKKRYSLSKFENHKHDDIEKEIKRYNKADFWLERFSEKINNRADTIYTHNLTNVQDEYVNVIKITDEHSGLITNNIFNTYNFDVMRERFNAIYNYIIHNVPVGKLTILSCGDAVHGTIHGSVDKHSHYMIDSAFAVTDCYIKLIDSLLEQGYSVTYAKSNGSHESLEKAKKDRTEEENIGRYIIYTLKALYSKNANVDVIDLVLNNNVCIVPIHHYAIATMHGDEGSMARAVETVQKIGKKKGLVVKEIQCGHFHHYKAEEINGVLVEHTESLCGTDQYAVNKGLDSPCGFRHYKYTKDGYKISRFVEL